MPEIKNITEELRSGDNRAVLVSVCTRDDTDESCMRSLDELERLLDTAGGVAAARITQNRETPDRATYVGTGKLEEIAEFINNDGEIKLIRATF